MDITNQETASQNTQMPELTVTSEIYEEYDYKTKISPSTEGNVISEFPFLLPKAGSSATYDDDDDLDIERPQKEVIRIEHSSKTKIALVGLQVWRGAFLLGDWLIHLGLKGELTNRSVLELGAGTGLTSFVAALYAKKVICTVIYDDDLTAAFVSTIQKILNTEPPKTLYMVLEKRYVFTIEHLDSVAPCYETFLTLLDKVKTENAHSTWNIQQLPLDFPKYFTYDRVKDLVLWKISSIPN
ncbi:hypothetical protein HF086_005143 [Spodoptera exigua]|uniref:Methyltransferase-like protein 22 n=1 Tax=Spodoptera exigua TaxID=7107 RepID=A0A922MRU7_SPOEX|nr:hypothetical protein HF086_005143 [Spodoptera exigua]